MTFLAWVRTQTQRGDIIGALASEDIWRTAPDCRNLPSLANWLHYVAEVPEARRSTVLAAWSVYRRETRTPIHRANISGLDSILLPVLVLNDRVKRALSASNSRNPRSISPALRSRVLERDSFQCRRCGARDGQNGPLVIDHVMPVASGGTASESNLQTLCELCNQGKADHLPHAHDLRPFASVPAMDVKAVVA